MHVASIQIAGRCACRHDCVWGGGLRVRASVGVCVCVVSVFVCMCLYLGRRKRDSERESVRARREKGKRAHCVRTQAREREFHVCVGVFTCACVCVVLSLSLCVCEYVKCVYLMCARCVRVWLFSLACMGESVRTVFDRSTCVGGEAAHPVYHRRTPVIQSEPVSIEGSPYSLIASFLPSFSCGGSSHQNAARPIQQKSITKSEAQTTNLCGDGQLVLELLPHILSIYVAHITNVFGRAVQACQASRASRRILTANITRT